jgi:uncharacterized protein (DUF885 family)
VALDVGIHDRGGVHQALAYQAPSTCPARKISRARDRRITRWPAQVVSYKVGEAVAGAEGRAARQQASFDVRDFHARVIQLGVVPISVLERSIRERSSSAGGRP